MFVSAVSHKDMWHLGLNALLLWECSLIEREWGHFVYFRIHFVAVICSAVVSLLVDHYTLRILRSGTLAAYFRTRHFIGYSPAVLCSIVLLSHHWEMFVSSLNVDGHRFWADVLRRRGEDVFDALNGIPVVVMLCAQILLDHTCFVHHIAGILIGVLIVYGAFDWLTPYWMTSLVLWSAMSACFTTAAPRSGQENDVSWFATFIRRNFVYQSNTTVKVTVMDNSTDEKRTLTVPFSISQRLSADQIAEDLEQLLGRRESCPRTGVDDDDDMCDDDRYYDLRRDEDVELGEHDDDDDHDDDDESRGLLTSRRNEYSSNMTSFRSRMQSRIRRGFRALTSESRSI